MWFMRHESGSMVIFGLFVFILMLLAGGMAVDFMRYEAQRSRLQSTLDRAVLAAASLDQPLDPEEVVRDYFEKAGLADYLLSIEVQDGKTSRRVTAYAQMNIGATFLKFSGINSLPTGAGGAAEESASLTEISLILDVSGSMGGSSSTGRSKIYELRKAAKQFVNIMQCDPEDPNATSGCTVEYGKVSISLVPYSEQVLAGKQLLLGLDVTNEHNYSSCVTFQPDDFKTVDLQPPHEQLRLTGHFDPSSSRNSNVSASRRPCQNQSWREIQPVEGNPAVLRNRIDQLSAGGYTSIDVAMKWGTGLLAPTSRPVIDRLIGVSLIDREFEGRPYEYDQRGIEKVIVLMTDGVNTNQSYLFDNYRSGPSPVWFNPDDGKMSIYRASTGTYYWEHTGTWEATPYGAKRECERVLIWGRWRKVCTTTLDPTLAEQLTYPELWVRKPWKWYEQWSWLGDPGSTYGNSEKDAHTDDICTAAKAQGITVFAVGFEVTSASAAVMRKCATSPSHYFDVNGANLSDAFASIAREISKLRLVN